MSLVYRQILASNSLRCCQGTLGTPCVAIKQKSSRAVPVFRMATAAAGVDTLPAAAPAAAEPAAAPAAAAAAAPEAAESKQTPEQTTSAAQSRSSSNARTTERNNEEALTVRVGANTNRTAVAAFMLNRFQERGDDLTIILQAVGAAACAQALKAVARLQQMVASQKTADYCVVFKVKRFRSGLQRTGEEQAVDPATGEGMQMNGYQLLINLGNRADWPAAAFDPSSARDASEATPADSSDSRSRSSSGDASSSSSSSDGSDSSKTLIPTAVKASAKDEAQRLTKHALRSSELKLPAQFVVAGSKKNLDVSALRLFSALGEARRQAYYLDEPADMLCTITAVPYTVQVSPRSSSSSSSSSSSGKERQQPEEAVDADASEPAAAGAAPDAAAAAHADAAPDAAADAAPTTFQRVRYVVTVQHCDPGRKAVAAAKRRKQQASGESAKGLPAARGRSKGLKPGYIEVKEEEWNQLKEQLAVVPHLTEQLQIMTRQHEQLLSLLAAQQGQQQEA